MPNRTSSADCPRPSLTVRAPSYRVTTTSTNSGLSRQHRASVPLHPVALWRRAVFVCWHPDADIDAPEAWDILKGNSSVTVAVIDSGVDYTSPDLAPNYAGGDDFVFGDGDPMDDHGHGTHVAGTIAAAMDNPTGSPAESEGVVGVAPNARILAYKVCRSDGSCDDFAIQQAIARAVTDGANIINMSLGESEYSQSLDDAVQDAWNAGLVIVAGAGNDGTTGSFYPAALNNVISVAAFDEDHKRPSFSNYGSWVDISAPGNVIMSTYPMSACADSTTQATPGVTHGIPARRWRRRMSPVPRRSCGREVTSPATARSWTFCCKAPTPWVLRTSDSTPGPSTAASTCTTRSAMG